MTVDTDEDLQKLKAIGRIVALTLQAMQNAIRPGLTTLELDEIGAEVMRQHGANSAPSLVYQFPGATCISINQEAAHGIPGPRAIEPGDLVNIDVSAEKDGYFADAALTVPVPPTSALQRRLLQASLSALHKGIRAARAGRAINVIGQAVEQEAKRAGFTIIRDLTGHGVGHSIHEDPRQILNYYHPLDNRPLVEGQVITIEPFLSNGANHVVTAPDGWTLKTSGGQLSVQFEHTLVVTRGQALVLTAL